MDIQRIVSTMPATLSVTWYPQDSETATDPDENACTVTVTHVNGTVVQASTAATRTGPGVYTFTLGALDNPADLIVTWAGVFGGKSASKSTYVVAITAHSVDLAEIRSSSAQLSNLTNFPTSLLVEKRNVAELVFETATDTFWSVQYARDVLDGDPTMRGTMVAQNRYPLDFQPTTRLMLTANRPRKLLSLTLAGTAVDPTLLGTHYDIYDSGELESAPGVGAFPRGLNNVVAEYLAGEDAMPADLRAGLVRYIRDLCLGTTGGPTTDRAMTMSNEHGTFRIRQADAWDNPTGLPDVDALLNRHGRRRGVFA